MQTAEEECCGVPAEIPTVNFFLAFRLSFFRKEEDRERMKERRKLREMKNSIMKVLQRSFHPYGPCLREKWARVSN